MKSGVSKSSLVFVVACALAAGIASNASAALLAYEPFNYPVGDELNTKNGGSGFGFSGAWGLQTGTAGAIIQAGSLAVPALPGLSAYSSGNSVLFSGSSGTKQYLRNFPEIAGTDGTTTWISFIGKRQGDASSVMPPPANLYPRGANVGFFNTQNTSRTERATIGNSSNAAANTWAFIPTGSASQIEPTTNPAVTYGGADAVWAVLRIDHKGAALTSDPGAAADKDDAYLFINPDPTTEPSLASANATVLQGDANAFDYSGLDFIRPFIGGAQTNIPFAELWVDEIRIGTTYSAMTAPEPTALALLALGGLALLGTGRLRQ